MKSDSQVLSDVVVIGYGTQRKSDLTGSVTNVSSKDFNMGLVSSPEQLINGKISGVQIMSNSGSPTSGSTIRVRGGASLNASNDPLIVLDGVPLEQGGISGNDGNFLSLINPNDIESMTILKDASSTAIYGSRASNGVILITTKEVRTN
jgi:TonB-dependent SusC/RagA subfamily outer membrane receptor